MGNLISNPLKTVPQEEEGESEADAHTNKKGKKDRNTGKGEKRRKFRPDTKQNRSPSTTPINNHPEFLFAPLLQFSQQTIRLAWQPPWAYVYTSWPATTQVCIHVLQQTKLVLPKAAPGNQVKQTQNYFQTQWENQESSPNLSQVVEGVSWRHPSVFYNHLISFKADNIDTSV